MTGTVLTTPILLALGLLYVAAIVGGYALAVVHRGPWKTGWALVVFYSGSRRHSYVHAVYTNHGEAKYDGDKRYAPSVQKRIDRVWYVTRAR